MKQYTLEPVGRVRSTLTDRAAAPKQGFEGAPDAHVEIRPEFARALDGIQPGDDVIVITWLHDAERDVLEVHPRDDETRPLRGVFSTRSAERPNPIGLHRVKVLAVNGEMLLVRALEAIDGTPVIDIKPVMEDSPDW